MLTSIDPNRIQYSNIILHLLGAAYYSPKHRICCMSTLSGLSQESLVINHRHISDWGNMHIDLIRRRLRRGISDCLTELVILYRIHISTLRIKVWHNGYSPFLGNSPSTLQNTFRN